MVALVNRKSPVQVLAQSAEAVSHTGDTILTPVKTVTIPGNAMGTNGAVLITATWSGNDTTDSKNVRVYFGGTLIQNITNTTSPHGSTSRLVQNRGATNSQITQPAAVFGIGAFAASAPVASAVDTTAAVNISFQVQLGLATDTITLESYQVLLFPSA